MNIWI